VTAFRGYDGRFATVIDSRLFHSLPVAARPSYLAAIARAARPGATLHALVVDVTVPLPAEGGPNPVTAEKVREAVTPFWDGERIESSAIHANAEARWNPAHLLAAHRPG
jgi:2-heptyl-1-hydroxyquinolin-4(1H)-one methyltransferase